MSEKAEKPRMNKKKKGLIIALCSVLGFLLLFSVASVIVCGTIYDAQFDRSDSPNWATKEGLSFADYSEEDYPRDIVKIPSAGSELTTYIFAAKESKGLVVFCHGLGGGTELYINEIIALVDRGWTVLASDFTGSFSTEGPSIKGFPQSVIDLNNILTWVEAQERFSGMDVMLIGHSWGGYAVTNVLNYGTHDIKAVVAVCPVYGAYKFIGQQTIDMLGFLGYIEYPYGCLYQFMKFGRAAAFNAVDGINKSDIPVMIVIAENDRTVKGNDSLLTYKDKIKNPNATFVIRSGEGQGTHNYVFRTEAAYRYVQETDAAYDQYKAEHGGSLTYEEKVAFYDTVDDARISEVDQAFMDQISAFFEDALS